jgi:serine/threonine-protein kinase SRPK3
VVRNHGLCFADGEALQVWNMVEIKHLFRGHDDNGDHNNRVHMAQIVSLLGLPPKEFLQRSPQSWRLFDDDGAKSLVQLDS